MHKYLVPTQYFIASFTFKFGGLINQTSLTGFNTIFITRSWLRFLAKM